MSPTLADLIAEGVVAAIKAAEGALEKQDVLDVIKAAMRAESELKMQAEFKGQTP